MKGVRGKRRPPALLVEVADSVAKELRSAVFESGVVPEGKRQLIIYS